jgi:hypothetical protein
VQALIFTVNSFSGEGFTGIPNAFCRLVDETNDGEIARFDLSLEGGDYTGLIMTKLYRHNNEWKMQAIGEQADGRTFHDLLPALRPYSVARLGDSTMDSAARPELLHHPTKPRDDRRSRSRSTGSRPIRR